MIDRARKGKIWGEKDRYEEIKARSFPASQVHDSPQVCNLELKELHSCLLEMEKCV